MNICLEGQKRVKYDADMTSLLELPAFRERVHRTSVEEYHRLGELGVLSEDVGILAGAP